MNLMGSFRLVPSCLRTSQVSIAALIVLAVAGHSSAQIYVDVDVPGGGDGSSWASAFQDLQLALDAAAGGGGNEIRIAAGTYVPSVLSSPPDGRSATFQLVDGVMLQGGYAGFGEPDPDLRDPVLYETRLSGDLAGNDIPPFGNTSENAYHVLSSDSTISSATLLDGLVIRAGQANGGGGQERDQGGGMRNVAGSPTFNNCTFLNNAARLQAAGMYNTSGAQPILTSCVFRENAAGFTSGRGGGMVNFLSDVTMIDCIFVENTAFDTGALYNQGDSFLVNCRFLGNFGQFQAGAVFDLGSATYVNCEFSGNNTDGYGGAVNYAPQFGTNLSAFVNCSFTNNVSTAGAGGAFYANLGSALPNGPSLSNCILWDDAALTGPEISINGPVTLSVSYCDVEGGQAGVEVVGAAVLNWGPGNIAANPLFVDADGLDNVAGTEDDDLHLMPNSPCINAGDPDFVADPVDEDIDGDPRIFNCRVEMGVDETLVALPGDGDLDGNGMTDVDDIAPMVDLLLGRGDPNDICAADLNGDDVVNGLDIQPFVAAMF